MHLQLESLSVSVSLSLSSSSSLQAKQRKQTREEGPLRSDKTTSRRGAGHPSNKQSAINTRLSHCEREITISRQDCSTCQVSLVRTRRGRCAGGGARRRQPSASSSSVPSVPSSVPADSVKHQASRLNTAQVSGPSPPLLRGYPLH